MPPIDTDNDQTRLLKAIGLVAVLGAHVEDAAWTLWHSLAEDPTKPRKAWEKRVGASSVLEEARKLARKRLDAELAKRVTAWTRKASTQLRRRNDVIHSVWPYNQLDSVPFRLWTGSQPCNEASIKLLPVDIGDVQELARKLSEVANQGTQLTWEVLEIYPDFLEGAPWR